MQTLSQLNEIAEAERTRAFRFEQLTGRKAALQQKIDRLTAAAVDLTALNKIAELAPQVPASVLTRGTMGTLGLAVVAGGMSVRTMLGAIASEGLTDAALREEERITALDQAKAELVRVDAELQEWQ